MLTIAGEKSALRTMSAPSFVCIFSLSNSTSVTLPGFDKISKEAEKGIKVVREKTQEGLDAIREFIDKKKEEFLKRGPEGLPHDNPKA